MREFIIFMDDKKLKNNCESPSDAEKEKERYYIKWDIRTRNCQRNLLIFIKVFHE